MGFFILEPARWAGAGGLVIAVEIQARMLQGLRKRAAKAKLAERTDARLAKGGTLASYNYGHDAQKFSGGG